MKQISRLNGSVVPGELTLFQIYTRFCLIALLLLCPLSLQAKEQTRSMLNDHVTLKFGVLHHNADATVSSNPTGVATNRLNLNRLGVDKDDLVPWVAVRWNFAERWYAQAQYSSYRGSGSRFASFNIDFDELHIPIDARVDTKLTTDIYILNTGYTLIEKPRANFDIGVGFHIVDFEFEIAGMLSADGSTVGFDSAKSDELAPLPNIMLSGRFLITDSLMLVGDIGWFELTYDDYDGELVSARLKMEWRAFKRASLGLGYQHIDIAVDRDTSQKTDKYRLEFTGPILYFSWGF